MQLSKKFTFTESDKAKIEQAVKAVEETTSGEVVVYFADCSDSYPEASWKGASLLSGATLLVLAFAGHYWQLNNIILPIETFSIAALSGVCSYLLITALAPAKRIFVDPSLINKKVKEKALNVFLKEEVFKTKNRTGILIFISYFEKRVEVIGDSGINSKVAAEEWKAVVDKILLGIKEKRVADGIINAISACGLLLKKANVELTYDDTNELRDDLRRE